jgi:hypothetical protein
VNHRLSVSGQGAAAGNQRLAGETNGVLPVIGGLTQDD